MALGVERVEIPRERAGLRKIADRVHAGVGAEPLEQAGVVVAERAEVELLRPAALGVEAAKLEHQVRGILVPLRRRGGATGTRLVEDRGGVAFRARIERHVFHAVVGDPPAERVEEGVAVVERLDETRRSS